MSLALGSVLSADSAEGQTAREDRAKIFGPATAAAKAGQAEQAARLLYEAIYQLPPGSFEGLPQSTKAGVLENARTRPPGSRGATAERYLRRPEGIQPADSRHVG
jgi:hypothetical protein